jgi:hypothetical protein
MLLTIGVTEQVMIISKVYDIFFPHLSHLHFADKYWWFLFCETDGMLSIKTTSKFNVLVLIVTLSHWTYTYRYLPRAQIQKEIIIRVSGQLNSSF